MCRLFIKIIIFIQIIFIFASCEFDVKQNFPVSEVLTETTGSTAEGNYNLSVIQYITDDYLVSRVSLFYLTKTLGDKCRISIINDFYNFRIVKPSYRLEYSLESATPILFDDFSKITFYGSSSISENIDDPSVLINNDGKYEYTFSKTITDENALILKSNRFYGSVTLSGRKNYSLSMPSTYFSNIKDYL